MAVSDKMVKSGCDAFNNLLTEDDYACPIQAVINAAWTDFDPNDESTWPKRGKYYLVECLNDPSFKLYMWEVGNASHLLSWKARKVIRYADLEHFRYEGG